MRQLGLILDVFPPSLREELLITTNQPEISLSIDEMLGRGSPTSYVAAYCLIFLLDRMFSNIPIEETDILFKELQSGSVSDQALVKLLQLPLRTVEVTKEKLQGRLVTFTIEGALLGVRGRDCMEGYRQRRLEAESPYVSMARR
jgi:hypothetical protein